MPSLEFVYVNEAFGEFAPGLSMLGRRYSDVFPDAAEVGSAIARELAGGDGEVRRDDVRVGTPSRQVPGEEAYVTLQVSLFSVDSATYAVVAARETTARVLSTRQLEEARVEFAQRLALAETLEAVNEVIHSSLDYDEIMQLALEQGTRALGARAGALFTELTQGESVARYAYGFPPGFVGRRYPASMFPFTRELESRRQPIAIESADMGRLMNPTLARLFSVRSLLAIPVVVRGELRGGIGLVYGAPHQFSEAELAFATAFGASLSLALQNADLYHRQESVASTLQRALLTVPERVEGIQLAHAYRGASDAVMVGGDFYDVFELERGAIGITVGDISGKGLDAAVLTSLVRSSVRAQATASHQSPAEVISVANKVLYNSSPPDSFATLFFGVLSLADGAFTYCNAGHTTGFVLRADRRVEPLQSTSPLVGAFKRMKFRDSVVHLAPGEGLFLYTDGVTEARQGADFFGEERLLALLEMTARRGPTVICRRVLSAVTEFAGGRTADDVALLALKRE